MVIEILSLKLLAFLLDKHSPRTPDLADTKAQIDRVIIYFYNHLAIFQEESHDIG